jgi:uncharacterized membrane protein
MSDWYYAVNNEQKGPVNESELKTQLAAGKLPADTLVWQEGMENWTPSSRVAAFTFREPPAPASFAKLSPTPAVVVPADKMGVHNPESITPVTVASLVGPGAALEVDPEDAENHKVFGILAYLGILCLVPLFAAKESPFAKYHANQGLVLFLVEIALWIVLTILNYIFAFLGLGFVSVILGLVWLAVIALLIIGIINAAAGKCVPLPVIGRFNLIK